ncbi:hypothetical protein ONZ45_g1835 [Pleurotus djamor]|nr:hypothetical protein ONZ45_g1835 [Pleurotus djamor]
MLHRLQRFVSLAVLSSLLPAISGAILQSSSEISDAYDFVIVGAGIAGSVVANRLTENANVRVLVLEAGGSTQGLLNGEQPFLWQSMVGSRFDWNFTTVPQPGLNNRVAPFPRGRALGGSSSINGMAWTIGSSEDYDMIAELTGDANWSWDRLQPYLRKTERWTVRHGSQNITGQFDPSVHQSWGLLSVSLGGQPHPTDGRVLQTLQDGTEFEFNLDANSGNHLGFGWSQLSVTNNARRDSAATAYLGPQYINRPNLHVLLNAHVTYLRQSSSAKFEVVEFLDLAAGTPGLERSVQATNEIILAGGVISTPNLLLHSGIGDQEALSAVGVTPTHHLPTVGQGLLEHVILSASWVANSTDTFDNVLTNQTLMNQYIAEWQQNGTGFLSGNFANHIGTLRFSSDASIFEQFDDPAAGPNTGHFEMVVFNGDTSGTAAPGGNYIGVGLSLFTPLSRGSVTIGSNDPLSPPLIDTACLVHEFDRFAAREALRSTQRFFSSPAWDGYVLGPAGSLATVDFDDDEQLDAWIRTVATAGLHAVGSAPMSPVGASWGVADPNLKVKGVEGLRIVDSSVIVDPIAHLLIPKLLFTLLQKGPPMW